MSAGAHGEADRLVRRAPGREHALAQVGVGHDADAVAAVDERGVRVRLGHRERSVGDRHLRRDDDRRAVDERPDPGHAQLRQAVGGVAGAHEPAAQAGRQVAGAVGLREHPHRRLAGQDEARARLARADGERRGELGQQRGVPEALAGLEGVDDRVGVHELHRARRDDVQRLRGLAVLDERRLAEAVRARRRGRGDLRQGVRRQAREGRVAGQEGRDLARVVQAAWSTTRKTGTRARRRTRCGSWDQTKLRIRRWRGGSAPITMASQPEAPRLLDDPLRAGARADHAPVRLDALALQPPDRLLDVVVLLVPLAPRRLQARVGEAERRAPDARDREHVHGRAGALGDARGEVDRRGGYLAVLGGEQHRAHRQAVRVGPLHVRGAAGATPRECRRAHFDGTAPGGMTRLRVAGLRRRHPLVLDPRPVQVERDVGERDGPAEEVVDLGVADPGVS